MTHEAAETVLAYHQATKHHFDHYARSPGYMDWANEPFPFRQYGGVEKTRLPLLTSDPDTRFDSLYSRKFLPEKSNNGNIAAFLELSMALSAWKVASGAQWSVRMNPSSGDLHPTETHLILPDFPEHGGGVFHYCVFDHSLELRANLDEPTKTMLQSDLKKNGFLVALSSIYWRESWKYGERAFRYCNHDIGHAMVCLTYAASLQGWRVQYLQPLSTQQMDSMLGFDKTDWSEGDEEHADLICAVVPDDRNERVTLSSSTVSVLQSLEFRGTPNQLSKEHVDWEIIDEVSVATEKPVTARAATAFIEKPMIIRRKKAGAAADIIRNRRSAQAFKPGFTLSAEKLILILDATLPRHGLPPFDIDMGPANVNLLLFVHQVKGFPAGVYFFVRNMNDFDELKKATDSEFLWEPVTNSIPLYLLKEQKVRKTAKALSCNQDIAGDSMFSLGMICRFRKIIEQDPWRYRHLFWECGMIGQVLYLEAEAAGVRGTGIGCYFDDPVHNFIGLKDNTFQDLYHFTIGEPFIDPRIQTHPPYAHLESTGKDPNT